MTSWSIDFDQSGNVSIKFDKISEKRAETRIPIGGNLFAGLGYPYNETANYKDIMDANQVIERLTNLPHGRVYDISFSGACLITKFPLTQGSNFLIYFQLIKGWEFHGNIETIKKLVNMGEKEANLIIGKITHPTNYSYYQTPAKVVRTQTIANEINKSIYAIGFQFLHENSNTELYQLTSKILEIIKEVFGLKESNLAR